MGFQASKWVLVCRDIFVVFNFKTTVNAVEHYIWKLTVICYYLYILYVLKLKGMWCQDYWRTLREKAQLTEKTVCHCITEIKCINRFVVSDLLWFLSGNSAITYIVFLGWGITSFLSSGSSKEWPCWITCLLQWRKQSWHTCREATVVVYHIFGNVKYLALILLYDNCPVRAQNNGQSMDNVQPEWCPDQKQAKSSICWSCWLVTPIVTCILE